MSIGDSIYGVVEGFYGRPWTTEQRHDLFNRLQESGLNAYLYAPKDDEKHRAKWRELYTDVESNLLRMLIESANKANVLFIYALSPGVDIIYSDPREVQMVKDKLRQVQDLGCKSFALLYDDILQEMRPEDQDVFESFADAQVAVTNECYLDLGKPSFSFCPTEYRGKNVLTSSYLKTVGKKLIPEIMVMWTGPAVVSRTITENHLKDVASIMRRKPLIWDNLHANDYDPKRVFMGPFSGRSIHIKSLISGVLLNPNCQYEANFLPIYTLGEWYRSDSDFDLERMNKHVVQPTVIYDPDQSLARGISKWIHLFNGGIGPSIPPISQVDSQVTTPVIESGVVSSNVPPLNIRTCEANEMLPTVVTDLPTPVYTSPIGSATTVTVQAFPIDESIMNTSDAHNVPQIVNSLSTEYSEPMETNSTKESEEEESSVTVSQMSPMDTTFNESPATTPCEYEPSHAELPQFTPTLINIFEGKKGIKLLVDFFYLPFNSGAYGFKVLKDFQWLHEHANIMTKAMSPLEDDMLNVAQWKQKADWIISIVQLITKFYLDLLDAPNRSLAQEIFPFVWEMQSILTILKAILEWMQGGSLLKIPEEQGDWWDTSHLQDEPWSLGGGLLVDLQKLIVKNQDVAEFFSFKLAAPPTATCFTLDTVSIEDINQQDLFKFFMDETERNIFITEKAFHDQYLVMFESYFTPTNHFLGKEVIPGTDPSIAAYFFAIADVLKLIREDGDFSRRLSSSLPSVDGPPQFIIPFKELPEDFLEKFPSYVDLRWRHEYQDPPVCVRRVLQCGVAALSLNGSVGCFTVIPSVICDKVDLCIRLDYRPLEESSETEESRVVDMAEHIPNESAPIRKWVVFGYSLGHVFNDMCASMWFTYLLIYLEKVVKMLSWRAGLLMLIGQVVDAITTPVIGMLSDSRILPHALVRHGRRIPWHFLGFVLVSLSFPFVFNKCLLCTSKTDEIWTVVYYIPLITAFQMGWACMQVNHLALIQTIASQESCQRTLSTSRLAASVLANLAVFSVLYLNFKVGGGDDTISPADLVHFRDLAFMIVGAGVIFTLLFYCLIREPAPEHYGIDDFVPLPNRLSPKDYLKMPRFYTVGLIYMLARLYGNVSQVYFPLYITMTLGMEKHYLGILPMIAYIFSFVVYSFMSSKCVNQRVSRNPLLFVGGLIAIVTGTMMYNTLPRWAVFITAAVIGISQSLFLTAAFAFCNFLIDADNGSSAFIYGSMSFVDKLANGIVFQIIEIINPSCKKKMTVLSKFFGKFLGMDMSPTTCYETIHVWNPDCKGSLVDIVPAGIMFCLKTYTMFYLISGIFRKRDPRKLNYKKLAKDVVRSSMMLFMNMVYLLYFICWFNHRLGFMTWPTLSFIPSIVASFLAILIENPSRRPMLALYLTNLASETLYRQLVNHGYLRFINNGESIVFALGLAMLTYFYKKYGEKAGEMMKVIKFTHHLDNEKEVFDLRKMHPRARFWFNLIRSSFIKHKLCKHKNSCASVAFESGIRNFSYGLTASIALTILKSIRSPSNLKNIFSLQTLQLPSFLAALPVIYHSVECGLTRFFNKKSDIISVIAGASSGGAMLFFPSTSIAMYFLWKGFEMIYFKLAEKGLAPRFKYADVLLYAFSTGFVLGNVIIEPHAVRKGYLNFLRDLTGGKLDLFNRRLFTKFGFDSNRMYEDFIPELDLQHVTLNPAFYLPSKKMAGRLESDFSLPAVSGIGNIEATMSTVIRLLQDNEVLYSHQLRHFFSSGVVDQFKNQYPDLLDFSGNDICELINYDDEFGRKLPTKIRDFINDGNSVSVDDSQLVTPLDEKVLPKTLFKGVSAKKELEIRYLAKLVSVECEKSGIKTILDVGCGKGNFMRSMHHLGFTVHGFEANADFVRIGKKATENYSNLTFTQCHLDNSNIQILSDITENPAAIVSLHGCGDLQKTIVKFFASSKSDRIPLLITVPCCYHKRTVTSINGWTMSRSMDRLLHQNNIKIPVSALRIAGDQGIHRFKKGTKEETANHKDSLFFRAVFDEAFPIQSCVRCSFQKLKTTRNIPLELCKIADIPEADLESNIRQVSHILEKLKNEDETLLKYSILQSAIQPILEILIFIDAAFCLSESGKDSQIRQDLPLQVTPRNKVIISRVSNNL